MKYSSNKCIQGEKSFKIIRRTWSSIRDLRVTIVCHESKIGLKCFRKKLDQNEINWNYSYNQYMFTKEFLMLSMKMKIVKTFLITSKEMDQNICSVSPNIYKTWLTL